jgi:hypothetical protein
MYSKSFKEFVNNGIDSYFIGTGNPNEKILLVGKESAISPEDESGLEWYKNNAQDWQKHIAENISEVNEYEVGINHPLRKGWGKNTWSKYQKLSDHIRKEVSKPFHVNFLKYCFTTEMNDAPMEKTAKADKSGLKPRKELFKNSDFIQSFPVVVLACSDYIKNNDEVREIDDVFGVTYIGDEKGKYWYSNGNWFFLHYNENRTKLVIHTRQLSANVNNRMLEDMGGIIRGQLECISILN